MIKKILYWLLSIVSEKNRDGKLVGSSKRISGAYFTGVFTWITYKALSDTLLPNIELVKHLAEYTMYFIIIMGFGIGAIGIVGKIKNNIPFLGSSETEFDFHDRDYDRDYRKNDESYNN
jgi:hypothetical protein